MKNIVLLIAIIAQLGCLIGASSQYGFSAGVYVLCAIIANSIQAVLQDYNK